MGQEKGIFTSSIYDPSLDLPAWSSVTESSFTSLDLLDCIDVKFNGLKTGKTFNLFRSSFFPSSDSHLLFDLLFYFLGWTPHLFLYIMPALQFQRKPQEHLLILDGHQKTKRSSKDSSCLAWSAAWLLSFSCAVKIKGGSDLEARKNPQPGFIPRRRKQRVGKPFNA